MSPLPHIRLTRRHLVTTLLVTAAVTATMSYLFAAEVRRDLLKRSRQHAWITARSLYEQIAEGPGFDAPADKLTRTIRRATLGTSVSEVRIFTPDRQQLYALSGQPHPETTAHVAALREVFEEGHIVHELDSLAEPPLLESYIPIAVGGKSAYALVLVQDGTELEKQFGKAYFRVGRTLVISMIVLSAFLYLLVRQANRHITRQTEALHDTNQRLETLSAHLEDQVAERSAQLVQAERLASLGRLAAGVAHEINTPLASISACSEGLMRQAEKAGGAGAPERLGEYLEVIRDEAFRCKEITQTLLGLSRRIPTSLEQIDPLALLERTIALLRFRTDERGQSVSVEAESGGTVPADPSQLQQVLLNVTTNAIDASPDGACIRWTVRWEPDALVLACADEGCGVNTADLPSVFDPFFTTKDPGQGTGLGLALCYQILATHDGKISIESAGPGQGTTVTIRLPREVS